MVTDEMAVELLKVAARVMKTSPSEAGEHLTAQARAVGAMASSLMTPADKLQSAQGRRSAL